MAVSLLCRPAHIASRLLLALGAAREENDDGAEKEDDHCREASPHPDAIVGVVAAAVFVDVVFDDAKDNEVDHHHDECNDPC